MDVTSIFHLASFYLSWVECNRGHIIYKTVLLLTCCSILQRMNSTGKFIPQPTSELMFGAGFCTSVCVLPACIVRDGTFNSFLSKCANVSKESSPLQLDSSWTRLFSASAAHSRETCSAATPAVQSKHGYTVYLLFCAQVQRGKPSLHSIDHLITVRKPLPSSIPSHCQKQYYFAIHNAGQMIPKTYYTELSNNRLVCTCLTTSH